MKKLTLKVIIMSVFISPAVLPGQGTDIISGVKNCIDSQILGESKEFWVHLPSGYENGKEKYPVLYITDGDQHFHLAAGVTDFMTSQYLTPGFIVVALFHKDRIRELTPSQSQVGQIDTATHAFKVSGGGGDFLQFIDNDLIDRIDEEYRTVPYRILAGHSLGGLFSIYAYLQENNRFNGFISIDPALNWDNKLCERILDSFPGQSAVFDRRLYISSAHNAPEGKRDKGPFRMAHLSFFKKLKTKGVTTVKLEIFDDENHLTVPYRSLYSGLAYLFSEYYIFNNDKFTENLQIIQKHYEDASDLFGMPFIPPEGFIDMLGRYFLYDRNEPAKAIEFFRLNTGNYPTSYKSYEYLARAYKLSGNNEDAIINFRRSLELNPQNTEVKELLLELESK